MLARRDVYQEGYEWIGHSMWPKHMEPADMRAKGTAFLLLLIIMNVYLTHVGHQHVVF